MICRIIRLIIYTDNENALHVCRTRVVMSNVWVECVPNFSEGRDKNIINKISNAIRNIKGVFLLDIDISYDFNRTVMTMIGPPKLVLEAAIASSVVALNNIDMTNHNGEHARMGAVDVVPFIPLTNATMQQCISLSEEYAQIMGSKYKVPIYLYAKSAKMKSRVNLPEIRKGEYESFNSKLSLEEWRPDFGPFEFSPKKGVTASGARNILIAYNVNLNTNDKKLANKIAGKIRESGVLRKDSFGDKIIDKNGKPERIKGIFEHLQAAGWMFNEDVAQVSMNFLDYKTTSLHEVTEFIKNEAISIGLKVTASELVGLVPLDALTDAGKYYSNSSNGTEMEYVNSAVKGLKLDIIDEFIPHDNIIEWRVIDGEKNE